jgi:trimeric autotransporter adhesin
MASGLHDFQFALYDSGGNQIGLTLTVPNVTVTNGIFTVNLDFGVAFPGATRLLEVRVKQTGGFAFAVLSPRQPVTSAPYSIKSLTAGSADTAASFSGAFGGDVTGTQGSTSVQTVGGQTAANIAQSVQTVSGATSLNTPSTLVRRDSIGNFAANIVDMAQLNLIGERAFGIASTNTAVGRGTAPPQGTGIENSYFGYFAGPAATTGNSNSYFGYATAKLTAGESWNSFFGSEAGRNSTGGSNSFFGFQAGFASTGQANAFFGRRSGYANTSGSANSFFGYQSGSANEGGGSNTFIGHTAGDGNVSGSQNTFVGTSTGGGNTNGSGNTYIGHNAGGFNGTDNIVIGRNATPLIHGFTNAVAIGTQSRVDCSNCMVLGSVNGINGATAQTNVGIGTNFPRARLHVMSGTDVEFNNFGGYMIAGDVGSTNVVIDDNEIMARNSFDTAPLALNADGGNVNLIQSGTGNVGIGTNNPLHKLAVNGDASKSGGGSWAVFSDARLKKISGRFTPGLNAIKQLNPIRFAYRPDNALGLTDTSEQVGFSAQEVQKVLPEAVTTSTNGYLQMHADPIYWTMLNAIKEQQTIIEKLTKRVGHLEQAQRRKRTRSR